jgi:WD40 repeat protein
MIQSRFRIAPTLLLTLCVAALATIALGDNSTGSPRKTKPSTHPATMPDDAKLLTFSADAMHYAYAAPAQDNWNLIVDGNVAGTYPSIRQIFLPASGHVVATIGPLLPELPNAETDIQPPAMVVIDSKPGAAYENLGGPDINPLGSWRDTPQEGLIFSPDGKHIAYIGRQPKGAGTEDHVVLDGTDLGTYAVAQRLTFSPDSGRFACVVYHDLEKNPSLLQADCAASSSALSPPSTQPSTRPLLVGTETPLPRHSAYQISFSPDSQSCAAAVGDGNPMTSSQIVVTGALSETIDGYAGQFAFSPDGQHIVCVPMFDGGNSLAADGKELKSNLQLGTTAYFSPDCKQIYYCTADGITGITPDGQQISFTPGVARIFSPDRKRTIDVQDDGQGGHLYELGNTEIKLKRGEEMGGYAFGPGNIFVLCVDHQDELDPSLTFAPQSLYVDGAPGPTYDAIDLKTLTFSPDGKNFAYAAKKDDDWFAVINSTPLPDKYDSIAPVPIVFKNNSFIFQAVRNGAVLRTVVSNQN